MSVSYVLEQVEAVGVTLRLNGERIRVWYPETRDREDLVQQMVFLRAHRGQVAKVLRARAEIPAMPVGVRLVNWSLEQPPVAVETCAVVTDPALFARTTLDQLRIALANPGR
jgi:hypothetical protein